MNGPLVTAAWLRDHLHDPTLVIADVRWYLQGKRGRDAYDAGHIPGAHFVDLDGELAAPPDPSRPGRHPLPTHETVAAMLSRLGVTRDSTLVVYDDAGGAIAARLWWMLRWLGVDIARVLDGGIGAWQTSGGELSTSEPEPRGAPRLELVPRADMVVDADGVEALRTRATTLLIDARAGERYRGETEPIDARAGHIPGAKSAPFVTNLLEPGGPFLDAAALRARYRELGAEQADAVIAYCGSGVTACHTLLALELAGLGGGKLYEGSWSDWAAQPKRPAATNDD